jgi:hypothetical protein
VSWRLVGDIKVVVKILSAVLHVGNVTQSALVGSYFVFVKQLILAKSEAIVFIASKVGHSLTVFMALGLCVGIAPGLGSRAIRGLIHSILVSVPMANILGSHSLRGLHFLGRCEIFEIPLTIVLGFGSLAEGYAWLRGILGIATVGKVKVRVFLGVSANISLVLMLRLLHGQFDILLVVEDARRLKVLTLTSLRRRHGSAASAWLLHKLFDILLVVEDARRLKVLTLTSLRRRHGSASSAWRSRFIS